MARPSLLLLDEPSLGLAPLICQQIFDTVAKLNKEENVTVFIVEQNATMALSVADRGYVLQNGKIVVGDTAKNLLDSELIRKAYLGEA